MIHQTHSADGTLLNFESSGQGETALLFVHGWLGNLRWWDHQRDTFQNRYRILQMDLGGHGKSGRNRNNYTVRTYAEDIRAVVEAAGARKVILLGHSMSGSYVIEAFRLLPEKVCAIFFVDTLTDLDQMPGMKAMQPLFSGMSADYVNTMRTTFAQFMFAPTSNPAAKERVVNEVASADPELAPKLLRTFYETDIRPAALSVTVPVRAINSDLYPTNVEANRKYLPDYQLELVRGTGHYPMLEDPAQFNAALEKALASLPLV